MNKLLLWFFRMQQLEFTQIRLCQSSISMIQRPLPERINGHSIESAASATCDDDNFNPIKLEREYVCTYDSITGTATCGGTQHTKLLHETPRLGRRPTRYRSLYLCPFDGNFSNQNCSPNNGEVMAYLHTHTHTHIETAAFYSTTGHASKRCSSPESLIILLIQSLPPFADDDHITASANPAPNRPGRPTRPLSRGRFDVWREYSVCSVLAKCTTI